ncbi:NADPH:quinone reductase [Lentithecium fluviatile CBS 122367]|uniref:NADPH:quinone reductase n=1 Tax=Lentithecium fluviatile CBS 122367 TaxID=1168545 RepID=A0A6G1IUZ6_9PLEO|nr:NADPH:quinone reductase [Lentithecium fluviatile CBS 122367]
MVYAAVVNTWGAAPTYTNITLDPPSPSQLRIKVLATGVHTLVRSRAAGKHYSVAGGQPPHIPGIDGVGQVIETGQLVYFNALKSATGSLAEEIVVEKRDVFPLAENADPDKVAVLANPALSSWMALAARAGIRRGEGFKVAIIGATGVSGGAAVQIAKAFGATDVVAIGKPGTKLDKTKELGATATIALSENIEDTDFAAAADVDVVLDYLWGYVAKAALIGMVMKRENRSQRLTWVHIGSLAGDELGVSGTVLRKANVVMMGCGPGSWTWAELGLQLPGMLDAIVDGGLSTEFMVKRLKDVESWWGEVDGPRVVVRP